MHELNIQHCKKCSKRQLPRTCTVNGQDIVSNALKGACPLYKFSGKDEPFQHSAEVLKDVIQEIPPNWNKKDYRLDSKGTSGCGCGK